VDEPKRICPTKGCPYPARKDSEYCWDCSRYRAWPTWRQRLNVSRAGALENVGYALVSFSLLPLHLLMRTDDVRRTLAKCAGDLRCGIEQAGPFDFAVEALLTLV